MASGNQIGLQGAREIAKAVRSDKCGLCWLDTTWAVGGGVAERGERAEQGDGNLGPWR